jgi:hypothetical protein
MHFPFRYIFFGIVIALYIKGKSNLITIAWCCGGIRAVAAVLCD